MLPYWIPSFATSKSVGLIVYQLIIHTNGRDDDLATLVDSDLFGLVYGQFFGQFSVQLGDMHFFFIFGAWYLIKKARLYSSISCEQLMNHPWNGREPPPESYLLYG